MHVAFRTLLIVVIMMLIIFVVIRMFPISEYINLARNASKAMSPVLAMGAPHKFLVVNFISYNGGIVTKLFPTDNGIQFVGRDKADKLIWDCDKIYSYFVVNRNNVSKNVCGMLVSGKFEESRLINAFYNNRMVIYYVPPGTKFGNSGIKAPQDYTAVCEDYGWYNTQIPFNKKIKLYSVLSYKFEPKNTTVYVGEDCNTVRVASDTRKLRFTTFTITDSISLRSASGNPPPSSWSYPTGSYAHKTDICFKKPNAPLNYINLSNRKLNDTNCLQPLKDSMSHGMYSDPLAEVCPKFSDVYDQNDTNYCCPLVNRDSGGTHVRYESICAYSEQEKDDANWYVCYYGTANMTVTDNSGRVWKCNYNRSSDKGIWVEETKYGTIWNSNYVWTDIVGSDDIDLPAFSGGQFNKNVSMVTISGRYNFSFKVNGKWKSLLGPVNEFELPKDYQEATEIKIRAYSDGTKRMFISNETFNGIIDVNNVCNNLANNAGLTDGNWKALLTDGTHTNVTSIFDNSKKYALIDGRLVFDSGDYDNPKTKINITEYLTAPPSFNIFGLSSLAYVWTGDGTDNCGNWSSIISNGKIGDFNATDSDWYNVGSISCVNTLPIYCIEE